MSWTSEAAVDLCVLCLVQAAPALALDPHVARLGWARLGAQIEPSSARETVVAFACSEPIKAWAQHMEDLDDEDRTDEWDDYWSETLVLAEVVIGAIAVFEGRAGWDRSVECERFFGYYREQLWHREARPTLSADLADGIPLHELVPAAWDHAQIWAEKCRARHDAASRPWPPRVPRVPPPRPDARS